MQTRQAGARWSLIAAGGIALEIVGLYIAVSGLAVTYRENFDQEIWADLWADVWGWVSVKILRRPRDTTVHSPAVTAELGMLWANASGQVRPPDPPPDATVDQRLDYLQRMVEMLSDESQANRRYAVRQVEVSEKRTVEKIQAVKEALAATDQTIGSLREAVIGRNGEGLRRAAFGLSITLVGVVLSFAGLPN